MASQKFFKNPNFWKQFLDFSGLFFKKKPGKPGNNTENQFLKMAGKLQSLEATYRKAAFPRKTYYAVPDKGSKTTSFASM